MGRASRKSWMRRESAAVQKLMEERLRQSMPEEKIKFLQRTGPKVSENVMELAQPWLQEVLNTDQARMVIGITVLAWNMSLQPESERWEGISPDFAKCLTPELKAIIQDMISRKFALFPDEIRSIMDYEIMTGPAGQMRLEVATTMSPEEMARFRKGGMP